MRNRLSSITLQSLLSSAFFSCVGLLLIFNQLKIYGLGYYVNQIRLILYAAILILSFCLCLASLIEKREGPLFSPSLYILVFTYLYLLTVVFLTGLNKGYILNVFLFPIVLFGSSCSKIRKGNILPETLFFCVSMLYLLSRFFPQRSSAQSINSVYYVVFAFAFVRRHRPLSPLLIADIFFIVSVIISKKGGAMLCLAAYYFISFLQSDFSEMKKKTILFFGLVAAAIAYFAVKALNIDIDLFGGSGRIEIYNTLMQRFFDRGFVCVAFGEGVDSTVLYAGITAHNDYLETAYDFGLVGLSLLVVSFFVIFVRVLENVPPRKSLNICYSVIVFFIMSSISHIIYVPTYFLVFAILWGLEIGGKGKENGKNRNIDISSGLELWRGFSNCRPQSIHKEIGI